MRFPANEALGPTVSLGGGLFTRDMQVNARADSPDEIPKGGKDFLTG